MDSASSFPQSIRKARSCGIGEFLEIIGELSQESTRKGRLGRKTRELITFGIALGKQCERCICLHADQARKLGRNGAEIIEVLPIALLMDGAPALSQIPHLVEAIDRYSR